LRGDACNDPPHPGKTFFLWYALIRLIKIGQPVAFVTNNRVHLFYDKRVWFTAADTSDIFFPVGKPVTHDTEHNPFLFVLIDHDNSSSGPTPQLYDAQDVFAIQASSPNENRFKLFVKNRRAAVWGLPLWDETELNNAYVFILS